MSGAGGSAMGLKSEGGTGREALRRFSSGYSDTRLPREDFEPMLRRSRLTNLKDGEFIFKQGDAPQAVHLVRSGRCQVEHLTKTIGTVVVGQLHPGDHFGEGAVESGRGEEGERRKAVKSGQKQTGTHARDCPRASARAASRGAVDV